MPDKELSVECIRLKKVFGRRTILDDITLEAAKGNIVALVGSNGAGKTTLLKILASLIVPTSGKALIFGRNVTRMHSETKSRIGFVSSEERSFYWRLTARQNLEFFAALYHLERKEIETRVDIALASVGLENQGHIRFREYSTGMKQALCIARGLLHDPDVLLLDEPTRSLSPNIAKRIRNVFLDKSRNEGKTILISSHNMREIELIADIVAVIHGGRIRAVGPLPELKAKAHIPDTADPEIVFETYTRNETLDTAQKNQ